MYDQPFGPGGIAGFIHKVGKSSEEIENPTLNHVLQQMMIAKNGNMPFGFVCARQLSTFEIEQFSLVTRIFDSAPIFFNVSSAAGVLEAEKYLEEGSFIITNHTVFDPSLTLTCKEKIDILPDSSTVKSM